jgi:hypothetical protein
MGDIMAEDPSGTSAAVDELTARMSQLDQITTQFGHSLSRALASGIVQGKSFDQILQGLGQKLIEISLRAAFKPLETGLSGLFNSLVSGFSGSFGGTSSSTTDFFGGGAGLAGQGGAAPAGSSVTVNMSLSTPDAESFRRSEAQVGAALARAVMRGQRNL